MKQREQILLIAGSTIVLLCSILAAQNLLAGQAMAQFPTGTAQAITPTRLTPESTVPSTLTSTATSRPAVTFTPRITSTPPPTASSTPTASNTPTPSPTQTRHPTPTVTVTPTRTNTPMAAPSVTPSQTPPPTEESQPPPGPPCRSSVDGWVSNALGQAVAGARVILQGEGWSSECTTDDAGHYGFSGLCSGAAVVQATLPNGEISAAVRVHFSGQNTIQVDLRSEEGTEATPQPTRVEAEMPVTGFSSCLLAGGAALAVLLLLTAGARRVLGSREAARNRD
jgi:hypothetical protein